MDFFQNALDNEVRGPRFEVRGSRFEVRGPRFEVRGPRSEVRGSRFEVRGSRSEVRGSRFEVRGCTEPTFPLPSSISFFWLNCTATKLVHVFVSFLRS